MLYLRPKSQHKIKSNKFRSTCIVGYLSIGNDNLHLEELEIKGGNSRQTRKTENIGVGI